MKLAESRLHRTRDHYYYRGSRWTGATLLLGSVVIGFVALGYGQTMKAFDLFYQATEKPYIKPVAIVQAKEQAPEPEYMLNDRTIKIINSNPTVAGAINKKFGKEWRKWSELIARESSFKPDAINPTSGACGLTQALPCKKMQCSLDLDGVECQLEWVENYVATRYGTIDKAIVFHDIKGWY